VLYSALVFLVLLQAVKAAGQINLDNIVASNQILPTRVVASLLKSVHDAQTRSSNGISFAFLRTRTVVMETESGNKPNSFRARSTEHSVKQHYSEQVFFFLTLYESNYQNHMNQPNCKMIEHLSL